MVDGGLDWQKNRLVRPQVVVDATREYFAEQDLFSQWLDANCEIGQGNFEPAGLLFKSWCAFAKECNEEAGSGTTFGRELARRGFVDKRLGSGERIRKGLKLNPKPVELDPRYPNDW